MEKTFCEQENDPKAVDVIIRFYKNYFSKWFILIIGNFLSQVLLEMHLFDNMPKCVKSSVDFVAERIASLCVKSIRQEIIPSLKDEINHELQKLRDDKRVYKVRTVDLPK